MTLWRSQKTRREIGGFFRGLFLQQFIGIYAVLNAKFLSLPFELMLHVFFRFLFHFEPKHSVLLFWAKRGRRPFP
jgi:hypothetical protein